ncbi:putative RNA methyltransferase [Nocardia sp. NPDC005978]|uniref:putative RNA methyltransferase n=1 Tax=Nocardia sp. NPDC005978 TaxID=3156725 RepID=UPI0033A0414B
MSHSPRADRLTGISVHAAPPPPLGPVDPLIACADLLSCPECGRDLAPRARALCCATGHAFDIARQGYVSLLTGAATKMSGDTPGMLDARAAFQAAGHFAPIATALAEILATGPLPAPAPPPAADRPLRPGAALTGPSATRLASTLLSETARTRGTARADAGTPAAPPNVPAQPNVPATPNAPASPNVPAPSTSAAGASLAPGIVSGSRPAATGSPAVLEIGAGTGYYLAAVLDALPWLRGIALDVSKPAARRAARAHPRAAAILADAWRGLPVRDGSLAAVLSVFAPRNADEVARALAPGGRFIVVTPTPRHLTELIEPLDMVRVDAAKQDRLAESLGGRFELLDRTPVDYPMSLTHADIAAVVAMGPSAFHPADHRPARIAQLPNPAPVTASVTISTYRPRP